MIPFELTSDLLVLFQNYSRKPKILNINYVSDKNYYVENNVNIFQNKHFLTNLPL